MTRRYPPEIDGSKVMRRIIDLLRTEPEGLTAKQITERLGTSPYYTRRRVQFMFKNKLLKVKQHAPRARPNSMQARMFICTDYALDPPVMFKSGTAKARAADENLRQHMINKAASQGPFGMLVIQATGA